MSPKALRVRRRRPEDIPAVTHRQKAARADHPESRHSGEHGDSLPLADEPDPPSFPSSRPFDRPQSTAVNPRSSGFRPQAVALEADLTMETAEVAVLDIAAVVQVRVTGSACSVHERRVDLSRVESELRVERVRTE
jgi:hypothetical protein